ncbi:MAG: phospholipid carrier-dependent glycosyltransferase [Lachnospiraceae bacterium]|nr:phospholipid carrier-dependent glycosyltransferase [Lachnospiraceae bacterium]
MKITKTDYICMGVLAFIFAVLVFARLGNTYAPETGRDLSGEGREMVIDFGEYLTVDHMRVFLGNLEGRKVSLSAYNEVTKEWQVIKSDENIQSVFRWNEVHIGYYLRYLGIVCTSDSGSFNEIVFYSPEGDIITPVNTNAYPELFDEQDMVPEYFTYMDSTYFDEVYHARTAYEFIHKLNTYETTHPHFGKTLISIGIRMFGMNPFGWRFMTALFGIFSVIIMYLFAKAMFESTFIATITGSFITFETMHLNLSRIATLDIFIGTFILLMYLLMFLYIKEDTKFRKEYAAAKEYTGKKKKKTEDGGFYVIKGNQYIMLGMCGFVSGIAIATKWTGAYAVMGIAVIFIIHTLLYFPRGQVLKLFLFCVGVFVVLPLLIYSLSFAPAVSYKEFDNIFAKAIELSKNMYDYHSKLEATHPYSSRFYQWPIVAKPLLDSCERVKDGLVSGISCMGNPVICWAGIGATVFLALRTVIKKDGIALFLIISYFAQYLPWFGISRCTFIYHYFPSILFNILMLGYICKLLHDRFKWGKYVVVTFAAVNMVVFFLYYPVVAGWPAVPVEYGKALRLMKDWVLVY